MFFIPLLLLLQQSGDLFVNCVPTRQLRDYPPHELYEPQFLSVLRHLNGDPDRVYNYNFGYISYAQKKTDDITSLEIVVKGRCVRENDGGCVSRIFNCKAYVEYFAGSNTYKTLPGVECQEKRDAGDDAVRDDSDESPEGQVVEEAIIPIRKGPCTGCPEELNTDVPGIENLINLGIQHVESESDKKHALVRVVKIERQIVSGVKFNLLIEIAPTVCSTEQTSEPSQSCPVDTPAKPKVCRIEFLQQPWISRDKNIISNNCTVSQSYDEAALKKVHHNDFDNEIDANGFRSSPAVEQHDVTETRPDFDKMAESGSFDDGYIDPARLAAIESEIIPTYSTDENTKVLDNVEATRFGLDSSQLGVEDIPSEHRPTAVYQEAERTEQIGEDQKYYESTETSMEETSWTRQPTPLIQALQMDDGQTRVRRDTKAVSDSSSSSTSEEGHKVKRDADSSSSSSSSEEGGKRVKRDTSESDSTSEEKKHIVKREADVLKREKRGDKDCSSSSSSSSSDDDNDDNNDNDKNKGKSKTKKESKKAGAKDDNNDTSSSSSSSSSDDDNNNIKRKRRGVETEEKNTVDKLVVYAVDYLSESGSEYVLLDVIRVNKIELEGSIYTLALRVVTDNQEKLCKLRMHVTKSGKIKILKSLCHDIESEEEKNRTNRRNKRQVPGGVYSVDNDDEQVLNMLKLTLQQLDAESPFSTKYKAVRVLEAKKQIVSGVLYRIKVDIILTECEKNDPKDAKDCAQKKEAVAKNCDIKVWDQPWLPQGRKTNITCDSSETYNFRAKRSLRSEDVFESDWAEFFSFLKKHKKVYGMDELLDRYEIYKTNMQIAKQLNKYEQGSAFYGPTKFADLTKEEFKRFLGYRPDLRSENELPFAVAEIPDIEPPNDFDWRKHNAVAEVKDQKSCGSCWAFSVTGNVEGQYAIKYGKILEFSEQELVDCDTLDEGCNGGLMENAYRTIEKLGGLEIESDYPYDAEDEKCHFDVSKSRVKLSGAVNISHDEVDMAKWLVKNGPISIAINANAMQFYMGGVSHPPSFLCSPNNLDHGVLIVGYGVDKFPLFKKSLPYWIVKNSWGKRWGEQGYYRVYKGTGTCGLNQMPTSSIVA